MKCPICSCEELKPYRDSIACYGCGVTLNSKGYAQCDLCGEHDMSVTVAKYPYDRLGAKLCDSCYRQEEKYMDWPRGVNIKI